MQGTTWGQIEVDDGDSLGVELIPDSPGLAFIDPVP